MFDDILSEIAPDSGGGGSGGFLQQILASLKGSGATSSGSLGGSGGGLSDMGAGLGGAIAGPAGAAVGGILGSVVQPALEISQLLKADKMAREHAGWLQDIAVNPPRPGWARAMSGPGLNK